MNIELPISGKSIQLGWAEVAIFLVWLFQLTATLGISLGYQEWFLSKTPLTLVLHLILLSSIFPFDSFKRRMSATALVLIGFFAEWIGLNWLPIFGDYYYGDNFGVQWQGTPLLIGFNWMILAMTSMAIAHSLFKNKTLRILVGASLMVGLDLLMEMVATPFEFWHFKGGMPPIQNYISWFVIGLLMQWILSGTKLSSKSKQFSFNLYLANVFFFGYFALYYLVFR